MIDSFAPLNPALVDAPSPEIIHSPDGHSGYPENVAAEDNADAMREACGATSREFPQSMWIEPRDWKDKAAENDKYKTWGVNYLDRFTHQGNSHECTSHALRAVAEAARNRQRGIIFPDGPQKDRRYEESQQGSVWLSPLSIYSEANPGQWGGAGCVQVLNIACRRGFLPEKVQPREYGFKHTLVGSAGGTAAMNQSVGSWVRLSNFPENWEDTAKWLMPEETIVVTEWEKAVCLLLHGCVLEYGRSGHAIPPAIWNVNESAAGYVDSYNRILYDSLGTFKSACRSGVFTIVSMRAPDDWLKPAGE